MTQAVRGPVGRSAPARGFHHPGRVVAGAFAAAIALGTALLSLPIAVAGPGRADVLTALFHATSAVCVTGLVTVDTGTYWSGFGQAVILLLVQAGGLGIMTLATLLALLLSRRLGLRARLVAHSVFATTEPPRGIVGVPLGETGLRTKHHVTVVSVEPENTTSHIHADYDTVLGYGAEIVIAGRPGHVERFVDLQ